MKKKHQFMMVLITGMLLVFISGIIAYNVESTIELEPCIDNKGGEFVDELCLHTVEDISPGEQSAIMFMALVGFMMALFSTFLMMVESEGNRK